MLLVSEGNNIGNLRARSASQIPVWRGDRLSPMMPLRITQIAGWVSLGSIEFYGLMHDTFDLAVTLALLWLWNTICQICQRAYDNVSPDYNAKHRLAKQ